MGLRIGAGVAVVAAHVAVVWAAFFNDYERPEMLQPEAVMVSVIESAVPQVAKAEPKPEEPVVEPPPPEPEVEPPPEPEPEVKPEPEPEPEPEPVIEKPPEPAPAPKPKPKPQPKPKPKPKPQPQPAPEPKPDPKPVEPPTGAPEGAQVTQAPRQGPPPDEPLMLSSVDYLGGKPSAVYPMASQRLREQGRVMVLVEINTQGLVDKVSVDTSSGFSRLDEAALTAARKARFKPLMRNGVPYPAKAKIPFDFVLRRG